MRSTRYGRRAIAVGGNRLAAQARGISLKKTRFAIFMAAGAFVGFAGVLFASAAGPFKPSSANHLQLSVIAGVILAGISLAGGRGNFWMLLLSIGFLSTIPTSLVFFGLSSDTQSVFQGVLLIIAVAIDGYRARRTRMTDTTADRTLPAYVVAASPVRDALTGSVASIAITFVIVIAVGLFWVGPDFLSFGNVSIICTFLVVPLIVGAFSGFALLAGVVDLSIGSMLGISAMHLCLPAVDRLAAPGGAALVTLVMLPRHRRHQRPRDRPLRRRPDRRDARHARRRCAASTGCSPAPAR